MRGCATASWDCCCALMTVMFVIGAVNLMWTAALALSMSAEKLAAVRWQLRYTAGTALVLWTLAVAASHNAQYG